MNNKLNRFLIFVIVITIICSCLSPVASAKLSEHDIYKEYFKDKTISILGDSISTYKNYSNGQAALTTNNTIETYPCHYSDNGVGDVYLNDTWWKQAANSLGAEILVNNSCSSSQVFDDDANNPAYLTRCENLHDNTGENAGQTPDIIAFYMGTNDITFSRSTLGSADDIDYKKLIKKEYNKTTYAKPKTTVEAYAITLSKIKEKYPDTEVYCFTSLLRCNANETVTKATDSFNYSVKKLAKKFGCIIVDVNDNTGIYPSENNYNRYIHDNSVHLNKKGMGAVAAAFLNSLYNNSKFIPENTTKYTINYHLDNVIVNEGTLKTVLVDDDFSCTLSKLVYGNFNIKVTMNDIDITETCCENGKIYIPKVTGNIKIYAAAANTIRDFKNYRFENINHEFKSVNENENTKNLLTQPSKGIFNLGESADLCYDKAWSIVVGLSSPLTTNLTISDSENGYTLIFDKDNDIIGITNTDSDVIFGIKLSDSKTNFNTAHTYKIKNKYKSSHGINSFELYVDSFLVGTFNKFYNPNGTETKNKINLNEIDFNFDKIGNEENPCDTKEIQFLQFWENDDLKNHIHFFRYPVSKKATCTMPRTITSTCDCGATHDEYMGEPIEHTKSKWITTKKATANANGKAVIKCTVCNKTLQTKTLKQLKCDSPDLISAKNTVSGIKVTWKKTYGADSYRVYRKKKGGNWSFIGTTKSTSYIDTKISKKNKTYYYYTVRAVNEAGNGSYEKGVGVTRVITPTLKSAKNISSGIRFTFSAVSGADYYRVYRKTPNGKWKFIGTTKKTTYYDKNVKSAYGKTYVYTVRAVNGKSYSSYRSGISVKRSR